MLPFVHVKGARIVFFYCYLKVVVNLANSADPDEMQHYAAFHLGHHCLPKYRFKGFQYTKDTTGRHCVRYIK